jgi:signal transduction histidine kinase
VSLTARLLAYFLAALGLVLTGFSGATYLAARSDLYRQLDNQLEAALTALEAAVDVEPEGLEWEPEDRRLNVGLENALEQVRWMVCDPAGNAIDRSPNLTNSFPLEWSPAGEPTGTPDATVFGDLPEWRLGARRLRLGDLLKRGLGHPEDDGADDDIEYPELTIKAGVSLTPARATLNQLGATLAVVSAATWLTAAAAGWWLCRKALEPLTTMSIAVRRMKATHHDDRLPVPGTRDELHDLAVGFNDLLSRRQDAFEQQLRFAGDASHELRTPLAGLLSLVEVIRRRPRSSEEYEEALDRVQIEGRRLQRITESLLMMTRAEAGELPVEKQAIDLRRWLPDHLARWAAHPRAADLTVDTNQARFASADEALLGQVVDNLIDNAFKYSEPGKPVRARAATVDGKAVVEVEDLGQGIAAGDLAKVFEPFFRSHEARMRWQSGAGLGLPLVQRIVAAMEGTIEIDSRVGEGSRARVTLPAPREALLVNGESKPPPAALSLPRA